MRRGKLNVRKMVILSIMTAIAVVVNILESFIPIIPGTAFKIGFANIITLIIVFAYGPAEAIGVGLLRIFVAGLLSPSGFGPTFMLSFTGGLFSLLTIVLLKMTKKFGIITISVMSSVMHVIGQLVAMNYTVLPNSEMLIVYYGPIMLLLSIPAGILTGYLASRFLNVSKDWFEDKKYS